MGKKLRSVGGLKREVQKPRMLGHSSAIGMRMLLVLGLPLRGRGAWGAGEASQWRYNRRRCARVMSTVVCPPDRPTLASGSDDTTVRLWGLAEK